MKKSIQLPAGTEHVRYDEIADLIADALWPVTGPDDERWDYHFTLMNLDTELKVALRAGALELKSPLTFGPHPFLMGNAVNSALMAVDDLRKLVAGRGLTVEVISVLATPKATPKKLTAEQGDDIRKRFKNGESVKSLSEQFNVSRPTIDKCLPAKIDKVSLDNAWGTKRPVKNSR